MFLSIIINNVQGLIFRENKSCHFRRPMYRWLSSKNWNTFQKCWESLHLF